MPPCRALHPNDVLGRTFSCRPRARAGPMAVFSRSWSRSSRSFPALETRTSEPRDLGHPAWLALLVFDEGRSR